MAYAILLFIALISPFLSYYYAKGQIYNTDGVEEIHDVPRPGLLLLRNLDESDEDLKVDSREQQWVNTFFFSIYIRFAKTNLKLRIWVPAVFKKFLLNRQICTRTN